MCDWANSYPGYDHASLTKVLFVKVFKNYSANMGLVDFFGVLDSGNFILICYIIWLCNKKLKTNLKHDQFKVNKGCALGHIDYKVYWA